MTDTNHTTHPPEGSLVGDRDSTTGETPVDVISIARDRYDNCKPIFTKDAMRDFSRQLKAVVDGQSSVISVRGLDGRMRVFQVSPDREPKMEFNPIQDLGRLGVYQLEIFPTIDTELSVGYTREQIGRNIQPMEKVEPYFKQTVTKWEATTACQHLKATLKGLLQRNPNVRKIDKIVAYACGSLSRFETEESGSYPSLEPRPHYQHALVMTLLNVLQNERTDRDTEQIQCYLQDPIYTDPEKEMLAQFNLEVVDSPEGFLLTDDSTAVLSFAPDVPAKQIVLDISIPSVIIWFKSDEDDLSVPWADPDSPRARRLIDEYYDVVDFQDHESRFGTSFYVKRAST
ncbi:hypothetical protein GX51_03576 [Blastomyces parvus]|uniref:SRR1-like domain-containing protein n=1 Tax=Blastomyces parvus TaxID=2060905 RepID=A0A2B7X633_9EURO|nr:hypothetical protein GX51_03576 [Blastomyces parvus]